MSENPLLEIRYDIPFSQIQPQHIEPAIKALLAEAEGGARGHPKGPRPPHLGKYPAAPRPAG
ncbi:MAG: hypothetical protein RML14_08005 [Meiothermus sp.]|uniref:hypothetical protein n=1 Tax=Meiothermus sp. TaxID=1955249 RepID=UPI00298EDCC2|nr:hypothetical protein [Meiothermus sp.]MDW8481802.1 hypothetical protein [Meiothermus sp.]